MGLQHFKILSLQAKNKVKNKILSYENFVSYLEAKHTVRSQAYSSIILYLEAEHTKPCIVFRNIKNKIQVVKEVPKVEELEASDFEMGASFSSDGIATPFSAMVPVASATIPAS